MEKIDRIVDGWKAKTPFERIARKAHTKVPGGQFNIETPDKESAIYVAGYQLALKESDPRYPAMELANYILGGSGFTSMLTDRVRQEEGLSYTVGSQFSVSELDEYSQFLIFATCKPNVINKADKIVGDVLKKASKDGVTAKEMDEHLKGWLEEQKSSRADDSSLASTLVRDLYLGRTFNYYRELESKVAKLTLKEVHEGLRELIQLNRLVIVRAGDFKKAGKN
jgi:zinc protease